MLLRSWFSLLTRLIGVSRYETFSLLNCVVLRLYIQAQIRRNKNEGVDKMKTIEDITSIKLRGGIFDREVELPLLQGSRYTPRFSLLYGKNGSGKSTVSRAFRKIKGEDVEQVYSACFVDRDHNPIELTDGGLSNLYIFDEDFIDDNIRIDGEGLNSIIVMGAVKDADEKIKKLRPDYDKSIDKYQKQEEKYNKYNDASNDLCPEYYLREITQALKGDDNWAGRDAKIHGNRQNSSVRSDTYKKFISITPGKKRDELIIEFNELFKKLEQAKSGNKRIDRDVPLLEPYPYIAAENKIRMLLEEKIEKPELTEREKMLFRILEEEGDQKLDQIKRFFSEKGKSICPFCFQDVAAHYAETLVISIEKILSKKVEKHQAELQKYCLKPVEVTLDEFEILPGDTKRKIEEKIQLLNDSIGDINKLLSQKTANVYEPIRMSNYELEKLHKECGSLLQQLKEQRVEYNKSATDTSELVRLLTKVNGEIAHYDISDLYAKYSVKDKERKAEKDILDELKAERDSKKKDMDDLEQEKRNARIAMNAINDDLAYIFFSKERLKIGYRDDKYYLYSHGRAVEPSNVSVGERNAIGLCYYFNRIMENQNKDDVFKQAYLLVIDDPVSSFDAENRIGILSYLKFKLGQHLLGNKDTRCVLMTHDLQTIYDARHFMEEILLKLLETPNILPGKPSQYITELELSNKKVTNAEITSRSEYTRSFEIVFNYAIRVDPVYTATIGNIMRKVMEAFGTFVYKKGVEQLSTDEKIISSLSIEYRKYFENLMYRLVLNTGSHFKEKVMTINDMKFFDFISDVDKQRTAKDIICYLYILNPPHVLAHLKKCENVETTIEQWRAALPV